MEDTSGALPQRQALSGTLNVQPSYLEFVAKIEGVWLSIEPDHAFVRDSQEKPGS